jgi:hypothetical protein
MRVERKTDCLTLGRDPQLNPSVAILRLLNQFIEGKDGVTVRARPKNQARRVGYDPLYAATTTPPKDPGLFDMYFIVRKPGPTH